MTGEQAPGEAARREVVTRLATGHGARFRAGPTAFVGHPHDALEPGDRAVQTSVLRLLRTPPPPGPEPSRVVAVDDRAPREGRTSGAVVVDPLPNRAAETLAGRLRRRPGIEVIAIAAGDPSRRDPSRMGWTGVTRPLRAKRRFAHPKGVSSGEARALLQEEMSPVAWARRGFAHATGDRATEGAVKLTAPVEPPRPTPRAGRSGLYERL